MADSCLQPKVEHGSYRPVARSRRIVTEKRDNPPRQPELPPESSDPIEREPATHSLLRHVRDELDQIEADLRHREQELAQTADQLQQAQATFGLQRKELEHQLAQREESLSGELDSVRCQLSEYMAALREREQHIAKQTRQQEALAQDIHELTRERDQIRTELTQTREVLKEQLAEKEQQLAMARAAAHDQSAGEVAVLQGDRPGQDAGETPIKSAVVSWAGITVIVIGIALSLLAGVLTYFWSPSDWRIVAWIVTQPGDHSTLTQCAEQAAAMGCAISGINVTEGVLTLEDTTDDPATRQADMNGIIQTVTDSFNASSRTLPADVPDLLARQEELERQIGTMDQRFTELTNAPESTADQQRKSLVDRWLRAEHERKRIKDTLADLAAKVRDPGIQASDIQISPDEIRTFQDADPRLRADLEALEHHRQELARLLQARLDAGIPHFEAMTNASRASLARIDQSLQNNYGDEIKEALHNLRESLSNLFEAAASFGQAWREQRAALTPTNGTANLVNLQRQVGTAARAFIDVSAASSVSYVAALDAISENSEEPTKGLVLRQNLSREFEPFIAARQQLESAARSVTLTADLDLATAVQRTIGLEHQVDQQRSRLQSELRQQRWTQQIESRKREIRAEYDRLVRQVAELDHEVEQCASEARDLISRDTLPPALRDELVSLQRQRAEAFRAIGELYRTCARAWADAAHVSRVLAVPAQREPLQDPRQHIGRALRVGIGTLLTCLGVGIVAWGTVNWLHGRRTIEAYTRELHEATAERKHLNNND